MIMTSMLESRLLVVLVIAAAVLFSAFKILREYERGVVFQLGRFWRSRGRA